MTMNTIFVYGTLKKGQPNEYYMKLRSSAVYLGIATTKVKYPLVIGQAWNLPMLLNVEGTGQNVSGELYEVNDEDLAQLDHFEGHPDLYKRTQIAVVKPDGKEVSCWTYFFAKPEANDMEAPFLETYDSGGEHGRVYDTSENDEHPDAV